MSEEEKILLYIEKEYGNYDNYVRDLLDLYNKEKEKNNVLENLLQGNLYEMYKYYKDLANSYQANYISKDKIRELLKEVQFTIQHESLDGNYDVLYYMTVIENSLKELLEEE